MEFDKYERRTFSVLAAQITEENLVQAATLLGELVTDENGERVIIIDRKRVPNMSQARVGWWITKMDDAIRCYAPRVFAQQFLLSESSKPEPLVANRSDREGIY